MHTHHTDVPEVGGMPLETNWGSFNVYARPDGMKAVITQWSTGSTLKTFIGETAWSDADRYAADLYFSHDLAMRVL